MNTLFVLASAAILAAPVPKPAPAEPTYFPTKQGCKWVYQAKAKTRVLEVTDTWSVGTKRYVWVHNEDHESQYDIPYVYTIESDGVYERPLKHHLLNGLLTSVEVMTDNELQKQQMQPTCVLKLPYVVGNKWTAGSLTSYESHATERVTTPAGTFDAVRVEWTYDYAKAPQKGTKWYAYGVGEIKSVTPDKDGPLVWELVKFTPGKD